MHIIRTFSTSALVLLFILLSACVGQPKTDVATISKQTETFAIKGTDTLRLDKYVKDDISGDKPCVVFMFGGGFKAGSKNDESNVAYMYRLAEKGYVAIAIDYRLGLKNLEPEQLGNISQVARSFYQAVNMAVEDLIDATAFIVENASDWGVDKELIIANGSSAGAISVLQGAYYLSNQHPDFIGRLPEGFNYAGVISFAGAILGNEKLEWKEQPAPMLLFHGNTDSNVPYDQLLFGPVGLYGSQAIASSLSQLQSPYFFAAYNNRAHEIANTPMTDNLAEIESFINHFVINKQKDITFQFVRKANEEEVNQQFEITDFIQVNFQ